MSALHGPEASNVPAYRAEANALADRMLRGLSFEKARGPMRAQPISLRREIQYEVQALRILNRFVGIYGVSMSELMGRARSEHVCLVRDAAIYWIRRRIGIGLPQLGRLIGGRDHTSLLDSCRRYPGKRAKAGRTVRRISVGGERKRS